MSSQRVKFLAPIARGSRDRLRFAISPEGREAETFYQVVGEYETVNWEILLKKWADLDEKDLRAIKKQIRRAKDIYQQGFSLVEAMPKTGRTIRFGFI